MITPRSGNILNYIIRRYITDAVPVPSQAIADNADIRVSPATIRNEMAQLEKEGYLIRPHTSAGCIPSDKGYRYYVESIEKLSLPREEQYLISHTFHQVEKEVDRFLRAIQQSRQQLKEIQEKILDPQVRHHAFILDVHLMILDDEMLVRNTLDTIRKKKVNAEWALDLTLEKLDAAFHAIEDEYLKERRNDLKFFLDAC